MSGIAIDVEADELPDLINAIDSFGEDLTGRDVRLIAGRSMQQTLQQHFARLSQDSDHHRTADAFGARRTGLYERAAKSTHDPQLESEGVSVAIEDEMGAIAQRYFGGPIAAPEGHLLTIPARTEAYGKRAREFHNLRLIMFPSGAGALVEREATVLKGGKRGARGIAGSLEGKRKGDKMGGGLFYWLVQQVHQDPDPTVLPTDEEILEPALSAVRDYIGRHWDERRAA